MLWLWIAVAVLGYAAVSASMALGDLRRKLDDAHHANRTLERRVDGLLERVQAVEGRAALAHLRDR